MPILARSFLRILPLTCLIAAAMPARAQTGARNGNGRHTVATSATRVIRPSTRLMPGNFNNLEVAWRFKTDFLGPRPEYQFEGTPLMVHGVIYTAAGSRRDAVALDAATGEIIWAHSENEGPRGSAAPRQLSGRGLAYWTDGKEERILYVTPGTG